MTLKKKFIINDWTEAIQESETWEKQRQKKVNCSTF